MIRRIRKTRDREDHTVWRAITLFNAIFLGILGGVSVGVGVVLGVRVVNFVFNGILDTVVGVIDDRRWLRRGRAPARVKTVSAPTSLRWVRGVLPGNEGADWLAEVNSCLAEAADPGERRRYLRSYRRATPQLIWTSWSEHLSASGRQKLS